MPMFKVLRLPLELRDELERKIADGGHTIDELMGFVRSRHPGADLSRAGLHRYARHYRARLEPYRQVQLMVRAWLSTLGGS
ncbi:MAG: phage protein Gp27 family protein [Candidatus Binataceae bacterium]